MPDSASGAASGAAPPRDADDLRVIVRDEFALELTEVFATLGGWDAAAAVWIGRDLDGRYWAIKTTTRDVAFGLSVAVSLADSGLPGVAAPLRARDGSPWVEVNGTLIAVAPWVEGMDALDPDVAAMDWEHFGRLLRAVHEHPPPATPPARRGVRRFGRSMRSLVREIDALAAESDAAGADDSAADPAADPAAASTASALRALWHDTRPRIDALVTAERRLKRSRTPTTRVTLHGDPHLGNVVVDGEGRPWLIDFDEATVAPREADLMLVELGVLFSRPISAAERADFRRGYGADAVIDERRIARFGCVRAIEDVASTFRAAFTADIAAEIDYPAFLGGMLGPDGLVTLVEADLRRLDVDRRD